MPSRRPDRDVWVSGVYPRTREILFEAYSAGPRDGLSDAARAENNRDRVMVTLLALNFLLMAFFAVLNSTAESTRVTVIAPVPAANDAQGAADSSAAMRAMEEERRRAVDVLRASVAQVFAPVIDARDAWRIRAAERIGNDRVDIEVPFALFSRAEYAAEGDMILEGIARVVASGVRGYRAELALRAAPSDVDVADLAQRLVAYGLAPGALSVGVLRPVAEAASGDAVLRFSFLLLDGDDDAVARLTARVGGGR